MAGRTQDDGRESATFDYSDASTLSNEKDETNKPSVKEANCRLVAKEPVDAQAAAACTKWRALTPLCVAQTK